jgi:hypothetical protein
MYAISVNQSFESKESQSVARCSRRLKSRSDRSPGLLWPEMRVSSIWSMAMRRDGVFAPIARQQGSERRWYVGNSCSRLYGEQRVSAGWIWWPYREHSIQNTWSNKPRRLWLIKSIQEEEVHIPFEFKFLWTTDACTSQKWLWFFR